MGARDYYKSDFYGGASAAFVSEIGFMGMPRVESMRKFLDEDKLWAPREPSMARPWHRPHRRLQFPVLVADRYDPGMRPQLLR